MRIILILMVLSFSALQAQKAALTAGSESLTNQNNEEQSITASETVITQTGNYTKAPDAEETKLVADKPTVQTATSGPNPLLYLVVFILIGISFYFINMKLKKNIAQNTVDLESEEKDELKKEMWNKLAADKETDNPEK